MTWAFGPVFLATTAAGALTELMKLTGEVGKDILADNLMKVYEQVHKSGQQSNPEQIAAAIQAAAAANPDFSAKILDLLNQLQPAMLLAEVKGSHEDIIKLNEMLSKELANLGAAQTVQGITLQTNFAQLLANDEQTHAKLDEVISLLNHQRLSDAAGLLRSITNNIIGTQNNVWGSQYNAQGDQYINCTFIGADLPLTDAEQQATFAAYISHLRAANGRVKLIGAENSSLPLEGVYVNLQAARRYEDHEQEHRIRAALREYEEKLNKDERLSPGERFRLIDECHFLFRGGLQPEAEQLPLDKAVITYPRLVIVGEPGSGKTTLLRYLAYKFASVGEESEQVPGFGYRRLPIFVRLTELVKQNYDVLAAAVADYQGNKANLSKLLRQYMERGLALFLFDGLDEVSGGDRTAVRDWLNRFADGLSAGTGRPQPAPLDQQPQGNRIIVTSRINSYFVAALDNANAHFVIQPLKTADRRLFLTSWYKAYETSQGRAADEQAAEGWAKPLAEKLEAPNLERLAEVPLLLSFLAYIWRTEGSLPSSRVQLYARMVKRMMAQRGEQPLNPATEKRIIPYLARLAFCLNANRDSGRLSRAEAMQFFDPDLQAHWEWLVETAGLLALRGSRTHTDDWGDSVDELMYGFPHRTFEEYFAALYLAAEPDGELLPLLRRLLHDPRWDEVILLTLGHIYFAEGGKQHPRAEGLLEKLCLDPEREKPEYEDLFHRDLLFALRAISAGIKPSLDKLESLIEEALDVYLEDDERWIGGEQWPLHRQLERLLENSSIIASSEVAVARLLHLLRSDDSSVWGRASLALGQAIRGHKDIAYAMIGRIYIYDEEDIQQSALAVLVNMGVQDDEAVIVFLDLLANGDKESYVSNIITDALVSIGTRNEAVTSGLMRLLSSEDIEMKALAAIALADMKVNNEEVVGMLLHLLELNYMWDRVIDALNGLDVRNEAVTKELLRLMDSRDVYTRWDATSMLWKLDTANEAIISELLRMLKSKYVGIRKDASSMLAQAAKDDELVKKHLLRLLKSSNAYVRESAAYTLAEAGIKDERVVTELVSLMSSDDNDAQFRATLLLGELGIGSDSVIRELMYLLRNHDPGLRWVAAAALIELNAQTGAATTELLHLMSKEDGYTRARAVHTVTEIGLGNQEIVKELLRLLNNGSIYAQISAAEVLARMGVHSKAAETMALEAMSDEGYSIEPEGLRALSHLLLDRADAKQIMYQIVRSGRGRGLEAAYEALYSIVSSQRSTTDEEICKGLNSEEGDLYD